MTHLRDPRTIPVSVASSPGRPVPACATCWYSRPTPDGPEEVLTCHRRSPRPSGTTRYASWPLVQEHEWCGEYVFVRDAP